MEANVIEVKNLAQLKRAIQEGYAFEIVRHYLRPENTGQIRKPTKVQTQSFYSVVLGKPEHKVSKANYGLGVWFEYGKASDWEFKDGLCRCYQRDHKSESQRVCDIRVLDIR